MSRKLAIAVLVFALAVVALPSHQASSFPFDEAIADCTPSTTTSTRTLWYYIHPPPSGFSGYVDEVRDGIKAWEDNFNREGVRLVEFRERTYSTLLNDFEVYWVNLSAEYGDANCGHSRLRLDPWEIAASPGDPFENVATHEAGHILGLDHSDPYSPNGPPVMTVCRNPIDKGYDGDDRASLNNDDEASSFTGSHLVANHGFEQGGTQDYFISSITNVTTYTSSSAMHGDNYLRMWRKSGQTGNPRVQQSLNYYEDHTGPTIDSKVWYRTPGTTSGTNVVGLKTYYRPVNYNNGGCATKFPYPNDPDKGRIGLGPYIWTKSTWGNATTSWTYINGKNFTLRNGTYGTNSDDSFDLRVRLWSYIGASAVEVDSLGMRDLTNEAP